MTLPAAAATRVPVIEVRGDELQDLIAMLNNPRLYSLCVWIDDGGVKFKPNHTSWGPPVGKVAP